MFYESQDMQKYSQAERAYLKAITVKPYNEEHYIALANHYRGLSQFQKAENQYKLAIELNPLNVASYIELGIMYIKSEDYIKAEETYNELLNPMFEGNPTGYMLLGDLSLYLGEYDKSIQAYEALLAFGPLSPFALSGLAACYQGHWSN